MDGIKKTALFLSGLEWKTVDQLLGRLDPDTARAVRREMMSPGSVSGQEANRLAQEFLQKVGGSGRAGRRCFDSGETVQTTYAPPHRRTPKVRETVSRRFGFLCEAEPAEIASQLVGEHPQTVTVVLSHLPSSPAGEVLRCLPAAMQIDVSRRLSRYEETAETVLDEIESSIRERFLRQHRYRNSFEELEQLGNAELSMLFHSVDPTTAMLALVGAKPSLIERVIKRFSPTEEYQMRQQLKRLGPIGEDDIRRARENVLVQAKLLEV